MAIKKAHLINDNLPRDSFRISLTEEQIKTSMYYSRSPFCVHPASEFVAQFHFTLTSSICLFCMPILQA